MGQNYSDQDILGILKRSHLFQQFEDKLLLNLIEFSCVLDFQPNEVIIEEGVKNDRVFIILEGRVSVYTDQDLILSLGRQGDLVGEMSVISQNPTSASVIAETAVNLFTISRGDILGSGNEELKYTLNKVFLDILTDKLALTSKQVRGFQATKEELAISEDSLYQKTAILQSILESMSDGVVVIDNDRRILHINDAFKQMVGSVEIPDDPALWAERLGFYIKDQTSLFQAKDLPILKSLSGKQNDSMEIYVKNDGLEEGIWLQASSRPLVHRSQGAIKGAVVVYRDITKAKKAEQALIKAKDNAEAMAKAKTDFLSVMSHELRTPLNSILGMADLLHKSELDEDQKDSLDSIKTSGESLLGMIKNILDFNDLESNSMKIVPQSFSVEDCLNGVVESFATQARQKGLRLEVRLDPKLPKLIVSDAKKICQVLLNMTDNAIKFTPKGGVTLEAQCKDESEESVMIQFQVSDTGIGISEEHIAALFEPFTQADSTFARKFEGTGLGLAIGSRMVELLGGKVWLESEVGKGTSFYFTIKAAKSTEEQETDKTGDAKEKPKAEYGADFAESYPFRILVAEDNKMNQKLIRKVLSKLGYEPHLVENGLEAVEAMRASSFDLILMDLQMPEMDGQEASKIIREEAGNPENPKIIALTANIVDGIEESCMAAGMNDYMAKPLRVDKLVDMLQKWG